MGLNFSNQCLEEVERCSELSEVLETRWKLSERCLEKAGFERNVMGLGRYVAQAGAEMGSDISNQ